MQNTNLKLNKPLNAVSSTARSLSAFSPAIKPLSLTFFGLSIAFNINAQTEDERNTEQTLERIVVTSDFSQRSPDNLASSVALIDEQLLEIRQAAQLEDIVGIVPNLNFSSGASRGKFIQIRGIGERSLFAEPINASVALVVDEINFSGLGGLGALFDVQQVEVLSGPQSTGFGASGLAGMIKIVSNGPSDVKEGYLQGSFAEYDTQRYSAAYSSKLTQNINARVALQQVKSDGYVENIFLNRNDTNNIDEFNAKLAMDYHINESANLELKLYHFDIDNGYDAFSLDNDNKTRSDEPGYDRTNTQAASIKYNHDLGDHALSISLTKLNAELDYAYDEDWTFVGFHPDEYSSFDRYKRDVTNHTLDARYASKSTESPWVLGFYMQQGEQDLTRFYTYASSNFTSLYEPSSQAIYGEHSWQVSEPLSFTAGARFEKFDADYIDSNGFLESLDDNLVAAKISASYALQKTTFYSSISRSYKAGGFNADERVTAKDRLYEPEYNWNYELGIKGSIDSSAGITGNLSLTFFYMQREDAQVNDFSVLNREDGSGAVEFIDVIGNADTGINKGMEIQTRWQLNDKVRAVVNVGYLDATFGNYQLANGSFVNKQEQAQAPKITFYTSTSYDVTENLTWLVEFEGKDRHRFSVGHDERAPFTAVFNSELSWQQGNMQVQLWAKNLFDRVLPTRGFGGFNNDPRDGYFPAKPYYQFGQERQFGVTATYRF
ncbi:MAG: iron complex outermembrane receptor protein [Glaciecola sp.]|jgi:iron complex outermembrane receptor protein|mmetsp:Transcript_44320/g.141066  ORF Transcript_44320/g.141066 Transcript_44320/m.141066 type:complete len:720 (+) Transcript_44320:163-2322(+)